VTEIFLFKAEPETTLCTEAEIPLPIP